MHPIRAFCHEHIADPLRNHPCILSSESPPKKLDQWVSEEVNAHSCVVYSEELEVLLLQILGMLTHELVTDVR